MGYKSTRQQSSVFFFILTIKQTTKGQTTSATDSNLFVSLVLLHVDCPHSKFHLNYFSQICCQTWHLSVHTCSLYLQIWQVGQQELLNICMDCIANQSLHFLEKGVF